MNAIVTVFSFLLVTAYGCDLKFTAPSGTVTSPNHPGKYPPNSDCTNEIIAPEGKVIYLQFEAFRTESNGNRCVYYDKLEVYDGDTLVHTFCGRDLPGSVLTTTKIMKLRFISDRIIEFEGYKANFQTLDKGGPRPTPGPGSCGGFFQGDTGTFTSPNYPDDYDPNLKCNYMLNLDTPGGIMILDFEDFELEAGTACRWDYVEVRDGGPTGDVLGIFCGITHSRITATGDKLHVRFVTDASTQTRGFKAKWQKASCAMFGGTCQSTCSNGKMDYDCGSGLSCCRGEIFPKECGKPAISPKERFIVGGEEAIPNSWPWQASLRTGSFHNCGASLINRQWVLTAAHCVNTKSSTNVVLGEHSRHVISGKERNIRGSLIIVHEDFTDGSPWPNDIALIKLDAVVDFNQDMSPPCMPSYENQEFGPQDGCYITGWGNTEGPQDRDVLQQLQIDPITNHECRQRWGVSRITETNICVGRGMVGSCQGDSGGPLVCKKGDKWVLAGATSWGVRGCKTEGFPSVYTRVSKFLDWVSMKIQSN